MDFNIDLYSKEDMSGTLIYGLATLGTASIGLCIRYAFKSKCEDVTLCCGLIKIHRNTADEVRAEQIELENKMGNQQPNQMERDQVPPTIQSQQLMRQESNVSL